MKETREQKPLYSPDEEIPLIHELRVHQIELETQNETLRCAQEMLLTQQKRYQDLYEQAPVGYLSLNKQALILDANNATLALLDMARGALLNQPLTRFIHPEDQDLFYLLRKRLIQVGKPERVELRMVRADGSSVWLRLDVNSIQSLDNDGAQLFRVALSDISDTKQIEETLKFLAHQNISVEPFFESLACYLAKALGMDFVCIDTLLGDGLNAQTLAVYHNGEFEDNVRYALKDTPCGEVVGKAVCCFPSKVCQLFPQDEVLKDLQAESYVGVTLWSNEGQPIGLIAVIGRQPLTNQSQAEAVLKLVAIRAAGELERLSVEKAILNARVQRKLIQDALRKREESYRLQFAQNSSVMLLVDQMDGRVIDANAAALNFYGYSHKQLLAMRITGINSFAGDHVIMGLIMASVTEEHGQRFEFSHLLADGAVRNVEVSISRIQLSDRPVLHLIVQDITKRKETENLLRKHAETYRDILFTTPDGFWLVDFQGHLLDVNDSYCRQSGYSRQELLAMRPNDLDIYENAADTTRRIQQIIKTGQSRFETMHRRKDGSTWHVDVSIGLNNKAGGQFVSFLRDISARKKAGELITQSLQEKEVLLKEIYHRVKNNLQVVYSMLSLQSKRVADPKTRLLLAESLNRICSMALIHERLYLSQDLAHIDFKGYLQSLIGAISDSYHCPNATCVVEMESIFLDVNVGIPCGLLANELVSNALKHAFPEGRCGTVTVGIHKNSQGDNVLTVEDNGIGWPPELDVRNTSSLGLQIVNGLTAQLHGTIELSTTESTKITITFPGTSGQTWSNA